MNKTRLVRRSAWVYLFAQHVQSDAYGRLGEVLEIEYLRKIVGFQGVI